MVESQSIYKSPEIEAELMELYDEIIKQWPVPYESKYVDTSYGKVHVITSGPTDAPPIILVHVSGIPAWSWIYNVEELSKQYRIYAIDTIGDAGRSVLSDTNRFPEDGKSLAELYTEITSKLGAESAYVVGGSQGGYIATNYTLYAPERVKKLVLLGPMGYSGTLSSVIRILLVTFFPFRWLQDNTVHWALGDNKNVLDLCGEWFRLVMNGIIPHQARPKSFSRDELEKIGVPVLLILGENDNLVGNPENAKKLASFISDVRVEVLNTAHAIGVEAPKEVNNLILDFIKEV